MGKLKKMVKLQGQEIADLRRRIEGIENAPKINPPHINTLGPTSWAQADIETVASLLAEHYEGKISIFDYWGIGDEREIRLGGEINETVQMVLTDRLVYEMAADGHGIGSKCAFTVDQKNLLANTFRSMNEDDTNEGGWAASDMRRWVNEVYADAIPKEYEGIFVPFMLDGNTDRFALRSEKELFGKTIYSGDEDGRQIEYYKVTRNRVKCLGDDCGSSTGWWERSPNGGSYFCRVYGNGYAYYDNASDESGLAPFGCL